MSVRLRWLNRLTARMQRVSFPPDNVLFVAAQRAQGCMQNLHVAAHYESREHGVGRPE